MLLSLSIRDFVIVDSVALEFGQGFTTLTGETGAGKSILIDALELVIGGRADPSQVRPGAARAEVAAEFAIEGADAMGAWVEEQAFEGDPGRLIVRRLVETGGRSRAFVNGHAATVAQLRELGERLIDIHGQHAHQSLMRPDAQRQLLDAHAGLQAMASETGACYREWRRLARLLSEHESGAAVRDAEREQLAWQTQELGRLGLREGEWESLVAEHSRLAHAASLIEGAQASVDVLSESEASAIGAIASVAARLRALTQFDVTLSEPADLLDASAAQAEEAVHLLRRYASRVDLDPARLREVDERVQAIHTLARRQRARPEELPILLESKLARLAELDAASDFAELACQEQAAGARYREIAARLGESRRKAAAKLSKEVTTAMKELSMTGARFEIRLQSVPEGGVHGGESVEFCVAANSGGDVRPLGKVASGGELSRISLAIQVITSRAAAVPTLIFDEVDAGIGGAVAEVVGRKLRALGGDRQVLCVTHLPQVAAQAQSQWSVAKEASIDGMRTRVRMLDAKGRIEEIARMLGGLEITATTRKHAAEMLGRK